MKLVFTMFLSIGVKALAAIIEILIQMLLTNSVGIAGYGDYTFLVSVIEGVYYFLFSGSIKINTFYLSIPSLKLTHFKKHILYITQCLHLWRFLVHLQLQKAYMVLYLQLF